MIPEAIYQLGLAASILFIVYMIIRAVLGSNSANDKGNADVTKGLINIMSSLSAAINSNTSVLVELRNFIDSDRKTSKETLSVLKNELLDRFGHQDRKVDLVIKMISELQLSLDDTTPVKEKPDGETRL